MATIVRKFRKHYLFEFSVPETEWIKELAQSMGITKEAVLAAAMNKGLTYYVETFHNNTKPLKKSIDDDACDDIC